jgi:signal transduction histidine kinase
MARDEDCPSKGRTRYYPPMPAGLRQPTVYRSAAVASVLFLGLAHGIHDVAHGDAAPGAFLPTISIALQIVILSYGARLAERRDWPPRASLAAAVAVSLLCGFPTVALHSHPPGPPLAAALAAAFAGIGMLLFWFLVFFFPERLIEARTRVLEAESQRRDAEVSRLRASLHPHFLLNTLNAVAGLLTTEPRVARRLVITLGDLLRDSLEDEGAMTPLGQEIEWLRRYAEIFEVRHPGAIRFEWAEDPESLGAAVPRLLLQPLLENAIEHGALQRAGGGTVTLRTRRMGEGLHVEVCDDGPGMPREAEPGLGLRLVEQRLRLLDQAARMSIVSSEAGTRVTLDLPKVEWTR